MADFLRNLWSGAPSSNDNEFIGQVLDVGNNKYRIKRLIAEGGFAFVFEAQDLQTKLDVAVKRLLAHDDESSREISNEISVMRKITGHPNLIEFFGAAKLESQRGGRSSGGEFLIVMELCTGGRLVDVLQHLRRSVSPGGGGGSDGWGSWAWGASASAGDQSASAPAATAPNAVSASPSAPTPTALDVGLVLQVFYQTCRAVQHLHRQQPPIVHRDLKLENLLLSTAHTVKLCDFGSCTTEIHHPSTEWTSLRRNQVEDDATRHTTPMYRPPEILDLYQNFVIGLPIDLWALGCVLFTLCYEKHPFEDSAKLRILNANYAFPKNDSKFVGVQELIRSMLQVDPVVRPEIDVVVQAVESIGFEQCQGTDLTGPLSIPGSSSSYAAAPAPARPPPPTSTPGVGATPASAPASASPRPSRPAAPPPPPQSTKPQPPNQNQNSNAGSGNGPSPTHALSGAQTPQQQQATAAPAARGGVLGFLRGGADSILKTVKDASSRVLESVSTSVQKSELDVSCLTSRLLVMSYPADSTFELSMLRHTADDVCAFLAARRAEATARGAPAQLAVAVYNLSGKPFSEAKRAKFDNAVYDAPQLGFSPKRAPQLALLVSTLKTAHKWLARSPSNIILVNCIDGKIASAMFTTALLLYLRLFDTVEACLQLFADRRTAVSFTPSQRRYLTYIGKMLADEPANQFPHPFALKLEAITIKPVPLFNRTKNGCTPYIEIYENQKRVFTSWNEFEKLRVHAVEHGRVQFEVELELCGDITICCYHARLASSALGGLASGAAQKVTSMKIFDLQFHTGYLDNARAFHHFPKNELDFLDNDNDRYPESFAVVLELEPAASKRANPKAAEEWDECMASLTQNKARLEPRLLVSSYDELDQLFKTYATALNRDTRFLSTYMSSMRESSAVGRPLPPTPPPLIAAGRPLPPTPPPLMAASEEAPAPSSRPPLPPRPPSVHRQFSPEPLLFGEPHTAAEGATSYQLAGEPSGSNGSYSRVNELSGSAARSNNNLFTLLDWDAPQVPPAAGGSQVNQREQSLISSQEPAEPTRVSLSPEEDPFGDFVQSDFSSNPSGNAAGTKSDADFKYSGFFSASNVPDNSNSEQRGGPAKPSAPKQQANDLEDLFGFVNSTPAEQSHSNGPSAACAPAATEAGLSDDLLKLHRSSADDLLAQFDALSTGGAPAASGAPAPASVSKPLPPLPNASAASAAPTSSAAVPSSKSSTHVDNLLDIFESSPQPQPSAAAAAMPQLPPKRPVGLPPGASSRLSGISASGSTPDFLQLGGQRTDISPSSSALPTLPPKTARSPSPVILSASNSTNQFDPFARLLDGMAPQPRPQQQPLPKMSTPVLGSNSPNSPSRMPRAGPFSAPQQPQPAAASQAAAAAKPNYFVGVGAGANLNLNATPNPAAAGTNIAPKVKADLFANLLGDAGAKLGSGPGAAGFGAANAPKTIKDLVHAKEAKLMDPDEFKVHAWADGKEKNIRVLLSTLHEIVWPENTRWRQIGAAQLVQPDDVKRAYRKACLAVHPDRLHGDDERYTRLARHIFQMLNDANSYFEETELRDNFTNDQSTPIVPSS